MITAQPMLLLHDLKIVVVHDLNGDVHVYFQINSRASSWLKKRFWTDNGSDRRKVELHMSAKLVKNETELGECNLT